MLDLNACRIMTSQVMPKSSAVVSIKEGALLAVISENGRGVVAPAAGSNTESPLGVARSQFMTPVDAPRVDLFTVPDNFEVTLPKTPNGEVGVRNQATGLMLTKVANAGLIDAATKYSIAGSVVTVHSSLEGVAIQVTSRYDLTVNEAHALYGQGIGDGAQSVTDTVDVITSAQILSTDQYDPTDNWDAGGRLYSGAGGIFTLKNTGTPLETVRILAAPSTTNGFLQLYFSM